jgi:uncharacterized protein YhdP
MHRRPADAAGPGLPGARSHVRMALLALAGVALLGALALLAYALAASQVPQQRATLESLVRAETGLDVRFRELRVRWGWYGPEAVFRAVELREPGDDRLLLAAPELVAGVDLWRMLRSGELAVGRITLVNPDIDLTRAAPMAAVRAAPGAAVPARGAMDPARLLAHWRGSRVDVVGGTLRAAPAGVAFAADIRHLQLRRLGGDWSADALLALPASLGAAVHAQLALRGDARQNGNLAGTLTLSGTRLELAGWHALFASLPASQYLPSAGRGEVTVRLALAEGAVVRADGSVEAAGIAWPAALAAAPDLALARLTASWHLERAGADWHLAVQPLAPVPLRIAGFALAGTVGAAHFDWSSAPAAGTQPRASAELRDVSVIAPGGALTLAGLDAHLAGTGRALVAELRSNHARLLRGGDPVPVAADLAVSGRLTLEDSGHGWRLGARELEMRADQARFSASGTLAGVDGAPAVLEAHAAMSAVPVALLRELLGARTLAALGPVAGELTDGRIVHAEVSARGALDRPLPWSGAQREFRGALELADATLLNAGEWPDLSGLDAHLDWRGERVRARVARASAGGFRLAAARGEWDARDAILTRLSGRLSGPLEEARAWLRDHPQLAAGAASAGKLDLSGATLIDFELRRAANRAPAVPDARYVSHVTALLDGARLRPVAGLPAIEALRGTLAFADGHVRRSTITGQWLGGPVALTVGERREPDAAALSISGRGTVSVGEALRAAGAANAAGGLLEGRTEWSADLRIVPGAAGAPTGWRAHADSSLIGVTSRLPEPFAKTAAAALPVHLELAGDEAAGELHVALGERVRGVAEVRRRGELWQVERGALNLAPAAPMLTAGPVLPAGPEMRISGSVGRLDLGAYAALWRELARDAAWPMLSVDLTAAELRAGERSFAGVHVLADRGPGVDRLRLESVDLTGEVRWPATADAAHPVVVHLQRLDLAGLDPRLTGASLEALGPAVELAVAQLDWHGRPLGALAATLAPRAGAFEVHEPGASGTGDAARGTLACQAALCRARVSLATHDPGAMLERLGLRPDLTAAHGTLSAELAWPADGAPALADLSGTVHLELEDGVAQGSAHPAAPGTPPGLLAVPGLIAAMGLAQLPFARLTGDFTLGGGEALTSNLHLDGDTEILLHGRVGLTARDYDASFWVLKGEERLPAAVRALPPGARVAALWLSLRELFGAGGREPAAWRLRGTWDDPMVTEP